MLKSGKQGGEPGNLRRTTPEKNSESVLKQNQPPSGETNTP